MGNCMVKQPIPDPTPALLDNMIILGGSIKRCQSLVDRQIEIARTKGRAGDRTAAISALKRKKYYAGQLVRFENIRNSTEQKILGIEQAKTLDAIHTNMKIASVGLQSFKNLASVEDADRIRDDMDEIVENAGAIQDAMGEHSNHLGDPADEDELEEELAALLGESMLPGGAEPLPTTPAAGTYVTVPSAAPETVGSAQVKSRAREEEVQARELEEDMFG